MLKDVVAVKTLGAYKVLITFEDGVCGELDLSDIIIFEGVFESLKDMTSFNEVFVNRELGTICWPGGADIDPDILYARLTGENIPAFTD